MRCPSQSLNPPWIETPCVRSAPLSRAAGCNIWLKLDNLQPSGSFKSRGIGNLICHAVESSAPGGPPPHFYCSSGGNAGLACATSAVAMSCPVTIVVPLTTPPSMVAKIKLLGAEVHQVGENWAAADGFLRESLLARDPNGVYVPPFDHPDIWEGAASLVDEIAQQLAGHEIDGIVCSVGGGGLLNGIMHGLDRVNHPLNGSNGCVLANMVHTRVLAVETRGADSLHACVEAGEHVTLPRITSIATSLGASRISKRTYEWLSDARLRSIVVADADAAHACVRCADDTRFVVEVACGATLATAYLGLLEGIMKRPGDAKRWQDYNVVLEVCGGSAVSLEVLNEYRATYM